MIKGSQKQLIVVRTGNSRYFDEAYFVLRRELQNERCDRSDILLEADRILRESAPQDGRESTKKDGHCFAFWAAFFAERCFVSCCF